MSPGPPRAKATYLASGESSGPRNSASVPTGSSRAPLWSVHHSSVLPPPTPPPVLALVLKASVPFIESENG